MRASALNLWSTWLLAFLLAFSPAVGDAWKIGRRGVGDGLLLVVAKNDRAVRIEVAKALEGAVPDLAARQIIDRAIVSAFRQGDFAGGLNGALNLIFARVRGETPPPEVSGEPIPRGVAVIAIAMLAFFTGLGIDFSRLRGYEPGWVGKLSMAAVGTCAAWFMFRNALLALVGAVGLPVLAFTFAKAIALLGRNPGGGSGGGTVVATDVRSGGMAASSAVFPSGRPTP